MNDEGEVNVPGWLLGIMLVLLIGLVWFGWHIMRHETKVPTKTVAADDAGKFLTSETTGKVIAVSGKSAKTPRCTVIRKHVASDEVGDENVSTGRVVGAGESATGIPVSVRFGDAVGRVEFK